MFADLSIEKLLVLALIGLFVLGPERLPAAVSWLADTLRWLRGLADDASRSLQRELGPEVDGLRAPLRELQEPLRQLQDLRRPARSLGRYLSTPASPALTEPGVRLPTAAADLNAAGVEQPPPPGSDRAVAESLAPIDPDTT